MIGKDDIEFYRLELMAVIAKIDAFENHILDCPVSLTFSVSGTDKDINFGEIVPKPIELSKTLLLPNMLFFNYLPDKKMASFTALSKANGGQPTITGKFSDTIDNLEVSLTVAICDDENKEASYCVRYKPLYK